MGVCMLLTYDGVACSIRRQKVESYWKLYMQDPFHSVVNMRLSKVLGTLVFLVRVCRALPLSLTLDMGS